MSEIPRISEAEWEVMKIFWSRSAPCTAHEIFEALQGFSKWKTNTVKTLITRLVKKGALGFQEQRRVYLYFSLVTEEDCIKSEAKTFIRRVFGGALKPMLVTFLQEEKLSQEDIAELKQLLEGRKD
ncbi:BlaI/MecI/CopY family transcriptional regulator [Desulfosporosinus sp. PR]|uniref:BlaI/MecI/CopY family transcriptional regulator n=1 Tax=Candidatus Desulfosporosinus nitrosoreducens TaxID=3401928 RepID=UPI0027E809CD|nr:BlaI/MecI/CopY family transcriptional regulator [Desulfosporosinus sp. PR]MDQ7097004.1 BlaI/MecI/CopY family transcriptional regulator [Desulfosporosinus sp. PR]